MSVFRHPFICFGCLLLSILFFPALAPGQEPVKRDTSIRFLGIPTIFFSNDTRWGVGAAGILTFKGHPQRSSVSFNITYTQRRQFFVRFPYQWYSPGGYWRAYGEVSWYNYLYQFFGIGNSFPNPYIEFYTAKFPRVRFTGLRKINRRTAIGIRYNFENFQIVNPTPDGLIYTDQLTGSDGGRLSGGGIVYLYDARDNQFYPRKGWFVETTATTDNRLTGSEFSYWRLSIDGSKYFTFGTKVIYAFNATVQFSQGELAFFSMPTLGGSRRLRGYPDGKYRDAHLCLFQTEARFPLFWRFKGHIFSGVGTVFGTPGERWKWRPNYGAGLRVEFDRKQKIHLRIDYGFGVGKGNNSLYINVGEAF